MITSFELLDAVRPAVVEPADHLDPCHVGRQLLASIEQGMQVSLCRDYLQVSASDESKSVFDASQGCEAVFSDVRPGPGRCHQERMITSLGRAPSQPLRPTHSENSALYSGLR